MGKYPYIADKKLYAAVMYACKMIRENGWYNKAVSIAADTYDVSEERIKEEIAKRKSTGSKGKGNTGKQFKWYIVDEYEHIQYRDNYDEYEPNVNRYKVVRALSKENAGRCSSPYGWGFQNESYAETLREVIGEYSTKEEAEQALKEFKSR